MATGPNAGAMELLQNILRALDECVARLRMVC
jgi:hypothetical protein